MGAATPLGNGRVNDCADEPVPFVSNAGAVSAKGASVGTGALGVESAVSGELSRLHPTTRQAASSEKTRLLDTLFMARLSRNTVVTRD